MAVRVQSFIFDVLDSLICSLDAACFVFAFMPVRSVKHGHIQNCRSSKHEQILNVQHARFILHLCLFQFHDFCILTACMCSCFSLDFFDGRRVVFCRAFPNQKNAPKGERRKTAERKQHRPKQSGNGWGTQGGKQVTLTRRRRRTQHRPKERDERATLLFPFTPYTPANRTLPYITLYSLPFTLYPFQVYF